MQISGQVFCNLAYSFDLGGYDSTNELHNSISFFRRTGIECAIFPFCNRFLVCLSCLLHAEALQI